MILRGALCLGMAWLCAAQGPDLGLKPAKDPVASCALADCSDPLRDTSDNFRKVVLKRLVAVKAELKAEESKARARETPADEKMRKIMRFIPDHIAPANIGDLR